MLGSEGAGGPWDQGCPAIGLLPNCGVPWPYGSCWCEGLLAGSPLFAVTAPLVGPTPAGAPAAQGRRPSSGGSVCGSGGNEEFKFESLGNVRSDRWAVPPKCSSRYASRNPMGGLTRECASFITVPVKCSVMSMSVLCTADGLFVS